MKNKLSFANTEENREYEEIYLRRTIKILLSNSINHIERCLVRWTAKKTLYTQMVERFLSFPPVQQVVLNNHLFFREAVEQWLEQWLELEQTKQVTRGTLEMKTLRAVEVMAIFSQVVVVVSWRNSWCRVEGRRAMPSLCPMTWLPSPPLYPMIWRGKT